MHTTLFFLPRRNEGRKVREGQMLSLPQDIELIGKRALDAAYTVHSYLGPGLLESVYQVCYVKELQKRKLFVESQ
ncbi:MAG TPA: GxxExxY protein, partial [Candidatus Kapabacteria bacterium]